MGHAPSVLERIRVLRRINSLKQENEIYQYQQGPAATFDGERTAEIAGNPG